MGMASQSNGALREAVHEIHDYIQENLYFNRPDMTVNGKKYNSALSSANLGLRKGKTLI
jgi:hypothetical protein